MPSMSLVGTELFDYDYTALPVNGTLVHTVLQSTVHSFNFDVDAPDHVGYSALDLLGCEKGHLLAFLCLFLFRYIRLFGNIMGYAFYQPSKLMNERCFSPRDVTVIVPSTTPYTKSFHECLEKIIKNRPASIIVSLAGTENNWPVSSKCFCYRGVSVVRISKPDKRQQLCNALEQVTNPLPKLLLTSSLSYIDACNKHL